MPILKIDNLSEHGVICDLRPMQLPVNALSGGQNIRIVDGKLQKFKGHSEYYDTGSDWDGSAGDSTDGEIVYYALPVESGGTYYWIYCGLKVVYIYNGSSAREITNVGADYSATADINWTGGIISGIAILNNGVDEPQYISDYGAGKLADITGWTGSDKCSAMRVYRNYLVAMDVTKSGTRYPQMVKWSDSAAIGALPTSWDETDPTTDAGENDLSENRTDINIGACLDCLILRDSNIIYTDSSTWAMQFIGGSNVFQFRELFQTAGALSRRCMAEFNGNHFVVTNGDVIVHNGVSAQSVVDQRRRRFLFTDMDGDNYERTFVFANYPRNEMWVCYVEDDHVAGLPSKALVWNWKHNTWGHRDLPNSNLAVASGGYGTPHIEGGIANTSVASPDLWSTDDGLWSDWTTSWGSTAFHPQEQSPVICADKLYKGDDTDQFEGTSFTSFAERTGIPIGEQTELVTIKRAYPRISGSGAVNIYVGAQEHPEGAIKYNLPVSFTPGTDNKVDCRVTGTHLAWKVESTGNIEWEMPGIDFEFDLNSRRNGA